MAVFRVKKSKDYTTMSNHHLRNSALSLKAKGLLSQMLSLPEGWDYTLSGLAAINREGEDAISSAVKELEKHGYIRRQRTQDSGGKFSGIEYVIYEQPVSAEPLPENPVVDNPDVDNPVPEKPELEKPVPENPGQLNKDISSKDISKRKNKKEKSKGGSTDKIPELSFEELVPHIDQWCDRIDPGGYCPKLRELMREWYSPRTFKNNANPPVKSLRGLHGLCNALETYGSVDHMVYQLDYAITSGWVGIRAQNKRSPPGSPYASGGQPPVKRGMEYEEV